MGPFFVYIIIKMNKHLKIAFFTAPFLALLAYYLTGFFVTPTTSENTGQQMVLLGKCYPKDNSCRLTRGELDIKLISAEKKQQYQLALTSNKAIEKLTLALGNQNQFKQFPIMKSDNNRYWQIKLQPEDELSQFKQLRLAFFHENKPIFADIEVHF